MANTTEAADWMVNSTLMTRLLSSTMPTITMPVAGDSANLDYIYANDLIHNPVVQIFFCIFYCTVFVLGVFGNVLVCYVVFRNPAMQTVTNIFITNLALSDILLCILAVPFTPIYTFMGRWAFGRTLCHTVSFAQGCSIYISTLTLTSIAIDRYFVIVYPFHPRMKLSTCICIIIGIWVFSILATMPYGMYMKVSDGTTEMATATAANHTLLNSTLATQAYVRLMTSSTPEVVPVAAYCEENWPSEQYRKVFGSVTTIFQFVLPFTIILVCYVEISTRLNERARVKPGSKSSRREEADRDRKKRTNHMLIAMVAIFGLSWLPINLVNIFDDFYVKSREWPFYTLLFFLSHAIAMSSTCYNPFLYAWLNENFRKEFKHVLPCFNPSNSNLISLNRGYNRSDRNTCGPRLHQHRNGEGGTGAGGSLDADDQDDNGITQDTCLPKDKLLIIPREPTYGNGSTGALSPVLSGCGVNKALVHNTAQPVDILLNDREMHRRKRRQTDDDTYVDSGDEQTIEVRFNETPFVSSDNTTTVSMLDSMGTHNHSRVSNETSEIIPELCSSSSLGNAGLGNTDAQRRCN